MDLIAWNVKVTVPDQDAFCKANNISTTSISFDQHVAFDCEVAVDSLNSCNQRAADTTRAINLQVASKVEIWIFDKNALVAAGFIFILRCTTYPFETDVNSIDRIFIPCGSFVFNAFKFSETHR